MRTYQYIKGNKVENALGYKLWKVNVELGTDGKYKVVDNSAIQLETRGLTIPMSIYGQISRAGVPAEKSHSLHNAGTSVIPNVKPSPSGYVYYLRVAGKMNLKLTDGTTRTKVSFSGIIDNLTSQVPVTIATKKEKGGIYLADNGKSVYLETTLGDVKVYDLKQYSATEVAFYDILLYVYGAHEDYKRTDFIPIDSLTDDLDGYCVGAFSASSGLEGLYYKVAFYETLDYSSFVVGAVFGDKDGIEINKEYLTVQDVKNILTNYTTDWQEKAKYVIFCSSTAKTAGNDSGEDRVSVGTSYFPLWKKYDALTNGGYLAVTATGDNVFFADSEFQCEGTDGKPIYYTPAI